MKTLNAVLLVIALSTFLLAPFSAAAQTNVATAPTGFERICNVRDAQRQPIEGAIVVCIKQIYLFSLGFGSLLALFMIVLAGYRYMTAGGNAEQVTNAKDQFETSLKGLIIIFVAFILLYLINPDLVQFNRNPNAGLPGFKIDVGTGSSTNNNPTGNNSNNTNSGGATGNTALNITAVPSANPVFARGAAANMNFLASPAGTYTWTLDDCEGNQLPEGLNFITGASPRITGTVSDDAITGTYDCNISVSGQGRSGIKPFEIVIE